jgi:hypothetical protein
MCPRPAHELRPELATNIRAHAVILAGTVVVALLRVAACVPGPRARSGSSPVTPSPCQRAFVFVDHGRPAARIEIPEGAGDVERRAAEILRMSILKMSEAELPVLGVKEPGGPGVAAIGFPQKDLPTATGSSLPTLRPDGFLVTTSAGNLFISGGNGQGVIRGVIHLLEKYFRCRLSGSSAGVFPRRGDLALGCLFEIDNPVNEVHGGSRSWASSTGSSLNLVGKKASGIMGPRD